MDDLEVCLSDACLAVSRRFPARSFGDVWFGCAHQMVVSRWV